MQCKVLYLRDVGGKGFRVAHVEAAGMFGDVPAGETVKGPGPGVLRSRLVVRRGRLEVSVRVEASGQSDEVLG